MDEDIRDAIQDNCSNYNKFSRPDGQLWFEIINQNELLSILAWLQDKQYYLIHLCMSDEEKSLARVTKAYYTFSGGANRKIIILSYPLDQSNPVQYPGLHDLYHSALIMEEEIHDMFGLLPHLGLDSEKKHLFLHRSAFSPNLTPLKQKYFLKWLRENTSIDLDKPEYLKKLSAGESLSVGPIHAMVIGAGLFLFRMKNKEEVEDVSIVLGFQHRGIEKIAEAEYSLINGWELAERVTGDTAFAYGLAHCQAVESLGMIKIPLAAQAWRALLLELERILHHVGDITNSLDGISGSLYSNRLKDLWEALFQLNQRITVNFENNYLENENFLLRGINRVGGVAFSCIPDLADIEHTLLRVTKEAVRISMLGIKDRECQKRFYGTGILTKEDALKFGTTGLAARASGLFDHDFRRWHPEGVYAEEELGIQNILAETISKEANKDRLVNIYEEDLQGDVLSRLYLRVAEIEISSKIIFRLIHRLEQMGPSAKLCVDDDEILAQLSDDRLINIGYKFGIGLVESWRGEVVCQLWHAPDCGIFRYSLRDPSVFNWLALQHSVKRHSDTKVYNLLADFPIINKSYNNSYPGVSK